MRYIIHSPTQNTYFNMNENAHTNKPTLFKERKTADDALTNPSLNAYTPDVEILEVPDDEQYIFLR